MVQVALVDFNLDIYNNFNDNNFDDSEPGIELDYFYDHNNSNTVAVAIATSEAAGQLKHECSAGQCRASEARPISE